MVVSKTYSLFSTNGIKWLIWFQHLFWSKFSLDVDVDQPTEWSTNIVADWYLYLVIFPFSWYMKPGRIIYSWSTEIHQPGAFTGCTLLASCLTFVLQGRFVIAEYMHPNFLGGLAVVNFLGIIPSIDRILSILKGDCKRRWYHLSNSAYGWSADRSSWSGSMMYVGSGGLSVVVSANLLRFYSFFSLSPFSVPVASWS